MHCGTREDKYKNSRVENVVFKAHKPGTFYKYIKIFQKLQFYSSVTPSLKGFACAVEFKKAL